MDYRPTILALAQATPLLPSQVAKTLSTDSIMAGAMLSEMCSKGMLKTSALKVGGSPLYYIPGKEEQLLNFLTNLNEKDRNTVALLREKKLLRELELDALTRVSLAQIKDFAHALIVQYEGKEERFYKWFELKDDEAKERIAQLLTPPPRYEEVTPRMAIPEVEVKEQIVPADTKFESKKEEKKPKKAKEKQVELEKKIEKSKEAAELEKNETGAFWDKVDSFLKSNKIAVQESAIIKKKLDFDLVIELPSPVGNLQYYCKVKSKKKISGADLSSAFVQGQMKKLPVIF